MGKSTIYKWSFSIAMLVYQRVRQPAWNDIDTYGYSLKTTAKILCFQEFRYLTYICRDDPSLRSASESIFWPIHTYLLYICLRVTTIAFVCDTSQRLTSQCVWYTLIHVCFTQVRPFSNQPGGGVQPPRGPCALSIWDHFRCGKRLHLPKICGNITQWWVNSPGLGDLTNKFNTVYRSECPMSYEKCRSTLLLI